MSSLQERKSYLQLWSFTTGPAIDVMKHYFEVKVLNTSSFESFLNDINNMHMLFHQYFPTTPCCYCVTVSLAATNKKGCLNRSQFDKLYINSGSPIQNHEIMKGSKFDQICLCKYSAKSSVTVNDLDITLFNDIVQHCCSSKINFTWRKSIKDVRNFLAHAGTGYINKQDFEDNWKTLNTATLGFAGEIGKVCEKMFQTEIVRIQNCSTDELKGMIENSTENQAMMINLLNGFKPIVDACKKTAELVHMKQESHDKHFENIQSALGQSTREIGEIKHKMNNFESFMKLMLEEKRKCTCDGSKRIKIETQIDNPCWNDENTTKRLCEMLNANVDVKNADKEEFYMKNVENKCIQIELVAFPDVFESPQSLRKAIKILINQLIDAGEVDTSLPGRMDIEFTIKTSLTKDEMAVAYLVFDGQDNLDDSAENGLDLKTNLQDHISVIQTQALDTQTSDNADRSSKTSSQEENHTLVDKKVALQKLGEIPLIEHQIKRYKDSIKDIERKWLLRHLQSQTKKLKTKEWTIRLTSLQNEKLKRTKTIEKLKDIICKKEDVTFTENTYGEDLGFLNAEMKAVIKCQQCDNKDESQISCYCGKCKIFLCDICENRHRLDKTSHWCICKHGILRSYKLNHLWSHLGHRLIDIKCINTNTIAVLTSDMTDFTDNNCALATYNNVTGVLKYKHIIPNINICSKMARINDSMVAITNPNCQLLHIATIKPKISTREVHISLPLETKMTGGVECRSDILYVACTDAVRLIDMFGEVQSSINVQNVGILHSLNSDKMLCVDSYYHAKSRVSCIDLTNNSVSKFINFPFYPNDITSDDVGNIIFRAGYLIWQADSDGDNFKIIMSPALDHDNEFNGLSYDKFSKTLVTSNSGIGKVLLYTKLEKM